MAAHSSLEISKRRSKECAMRKFSQRIEMIVYRFIISLVIGFFLGSYLIANSNNGALETIETILCHGQKTNIRHRILSDDWFPKKEPRFDNERGLLYVGMMSMTQYLDSRVSAVMDTWAKNKDIRLEIFASNNGSASKGPGKMTLLEKGARIIELPGVSDVSYPPQKKSFSMLKFMHDNHLEKFEWFLRVDDDAYIKIDELTNLLSRADPNKPHFIGHAGYGKHSEDYLESGENYCMGGTGVLFSRNLLRKIGPKLVECLREMYTEHEDVELGRCVRKVAGVGCTESWETTSLFYQNYGGKGSYDMNIKDISERKRVVAVTFHANKDPKYQYKLHQSILEDKITNLITKITRMETEIKKMTSLLAFRKFDDKAWNAHAGFLWEAISQKSVYSATSSLVRGIPTSVKNAAVRNVFYTIHDLRSQHEILQSHIKEISVTQTRYFVNPLTSVDMISRLRVQGTTVSKKRVQLYLNNIYFRRTFPENWVYITEDSDIHFGAVREGVRKGVKKIKTGYPTRVNFIMALSGRADNLVRFLQNYKENFLAYGENVSITIVHFPESTPPAETGESIIDVDDKEKSAKVSKQDEESQFIIANLDGVTREYPSAKVNFLPVKNGLSFSRGAGLQMGAKKFRNDDLLFFCDVDLVFTSDILHHIRRSTIKGKQVYYPTFFSQYDPEIVYSYQEAPETHFYFEEIAGFWRTFSYGMVSIYKSDFVRTGGFDLTIKGWGLEDLKFCDAVMKKAKLRLFKSNEPAMVHIYHDKDCPGDLRPEQRKSCRNSRAQHFGPQTLLYYVFQRGDEAEEDEFDPKVKVEAQVQDSPNEPEREA